jgi:Domain of unknown function (DUF4203)
MLPQAYQQPAALLLILGGVLACFAGYRLFRTVLAIYGFILGAMLASSTMGATNTIGMIAAAVVGGLVGALVLVFAYFVGVALIGAGLGALVVHVGWTQLGKPDPPAALVIAFAVLGAIGAMILQRYVIVVGTAFGGAWTIVVGTLAILGSRAAQRAASGADVWILYPLTPAPGQPWVPIAWIALGIFGTAVQLGITARKK